MPYGDSPLRASWRSLLYPGTFCLVLAVQHWRGRERAPSCPRGELRGGDVLTCSRGVVAAALLARSASIDGPARLGPLPWSVLLAACTAADWFDGPLARREPARSPYGAWLDAEMDSWLTFALALAGIRNRTLPPPVVIAPALTLIAPARHHSHAVPARSIGGMQMAMFLTALAPLANRPNGPVFRRTVAIVAGLSLLSYLVQSGLFRAPRLI